MWLMPREIKDKCLVACNETYVSYLPLSPQIIALLLRLSSFISCGISHISPPISPYLLLRASLAEGKRRLNIFHI